MYTSFSYLYILKATLSNDSGHTWKCLRRSGGFGELSGNTSVEQWKTESVISEQLEVKERIKGHGLGMKYLREAVHCVSGGDQ